MTYTSESYICRICISLKLQPLSDLKGMNNFNARKNTDRQTDRHVHTNVYKYKKTHTHTSQLELRKRNSE